MEQTIDNKIIRPTMTDDEIITLSNDELDYIDSLAENLMTQVNRAKELQEMQQKANIGLQQCKDEVNGYVKAINAIVKSIVKRSGHEGEFLYDKENKRLVRKKE